MISITTKIASLVAVVVMAFSFLASGGSVSAAAKSPQYIRDELRLGYNTAIAMDWNNGVSPGIYPNPSCRQVIASRYSSWSGSKLYSNGDYGISPPAASASYRYDTWISGASKGNAVSPIAIGVNQQDVQLRINSLSFVCRPFANPVPPASCGLTGQQWIDRGGYWIYKDGISDTGVHDTGSSNYSNPRSNSCFINLKSWQKTQLVSLTATDGSIRGYTSGDVMTINKDAASRYWMTRKGIVYHSNSPITYAQYPNGKRITITMKYRQQNSYKNGVTTCKSSSGSGSATGTNNVTLAWSGCYTYTANLTFVLMPQKPPPPPPTNSIACGPSTFPVAGSVNRAINFSVSARLGYWNSSFSSPNNPKLTVEVKDPSGRVIFNNGGQPLSYNRSADSRTITSTNIPFNPSVPGRYALAWSAEIAGLPRVNCQSSSTVGSQPYFEVMGGDVLAGMSYSSGSKTIDSNLALIMAWNSNTSADKFAGGKTNLAAIARGDINGFVTGDLTVSNPSVLAFANTAASNPIYGGQFEASLDRPDYISEIDDLATDYYGGSSIDLASFNESGVFRIKNDVTIRGQLKKGISVTLIVSDGRSVFIDQNISYGSYELNTIPSFNLYVDGGNIVVGGNVTEIRGVFVAQSDDSGKGNFYSCGRSATAPVTFQSMASDLSTYGLCNRQLTIHGSVAADHLVLARTSGSWISPGNVPAEVFKYSPEVWLGPASKGDPRGFDSYISLPPVL